MKILFYINTLGRGGAERALVNVSGGLAENGHEVVLVTSFSEENEYTHHASVKRINLASKRIDGRDRQRYAYRWQKGEGNHTLALR